MEFTEAFNSALRKTMNKWTEEDGNLTKSRQNTAVVIQALRDAASESGNVTLLTVLALCDTD